MLKKILIAGAAMAALSLSAGAGHADTTDDLLKRLLEKGILTQAEYDQLAQRKSTETATPTMRGGSDAAAPAGAGGGSTETSMAAATPETPAGALDKRYVRMSDSGVGIQLGPVAVKVSGSINGFYTHDSGDAPAANRTVVGGLATVGGDSSSIRNGLLPGFIKLDVTTNQAGFDVGAHVALWPGIDSVTGVGGANSAGNPSALASAGIDARQVYLTVGRKDLGEVKIGRDIGLFGSDAILNDLTLLGVGTAAGNSAPSNTSIGRIGVGYIYTDFQPQITYTSPTYHGFQGAIGAFQPLVTAGLSEVNSQTGFQGKLTYDYTAKPMSAHLWADFVSQKHDASATQTAYTGAGFDVGGKLTAGPLGLVGYYYKGSGLGTTGLFILSTDGAGHRRDSDGFYVQGSYTLFTKMTLGVSYGESRLDLASGEINPTLLKTNSSYIFQDRYALTPWFSLVGEYTHTMSDAQASNTAASDAVALGGILFF